MVLLGGTLQAHNLHRRISRIPPAASLFLALAEAIVHQQLTAKAAGTIFARVRALFPGTAEGPTPRELLRLSDAALRAAPS